MYCITDSHSELSMAGGGGGRAGRRGGAAGGDKRVAPSSVNIGRPGLSRAHRVGALARCIAALQELGSRRPASSRANHSLPVQMQMQVRAQVSAVAGGKRRWGRRPAEYRETCRSDFEGATVSRHGQLPVVWARLHRPRPISAPARPVRRANRRATLAEPQSTTG